MNLQTYRDKREQSPTYQTIKADLKLTFDLADRILELRLERGWSQAELATRLQATEYYVNELECGLTSPTVRMLELIAREFGVELRVELG